MQKIQGWVEQGNTVLSITGAAGTISRKVQGSFPSATVTVYIAATITTVSIYSDDANPPTAKANPFTSASDGTWSFYVPNGVYDIKFSGGGITAPFTIGAVSAGSAPSGPPSYAYASLPTSKSQNAGNLSRVNDTYGGLWMDNGTRWAKLFPPINACDYPYLADFNGVNDATSGINSALTEAASLVPTVNTYTYGTVWVTLQPGTYKIAGTLTIPTGVGLCAPFGIALLVASSGATTTLIDTTVYSSGNTPHYNGALVGIDLYGLGAGTALAGLRINNAQNFLVEHCRFTNFSNQALLVQSGYDGSGFTGSASANTCIFSDIRAFNNLLNTSPLSRIGSIQVMGSDHEFYGCETFNPAGRTLSSGSKFCVGWYLVGCNESRFFGCKGSVYDQGWYINSAAQVNFFDNCRADGNLAEGFFVDGSENIWDLIDCNGNGQAAANTYDQVVFTSNAVFNRINSGSIINVANPGTSYRYGVTDNNTVAAQANALGANLLIRNAGTGPINNNGAVLSVTLADGPAQSLSLNSATPSILSSGNQPWKNWKTNSNTSTTVTNFTGGFGGQIITVIMNDGNTFIQNNSTIATANGVDIQPVNGQAFTFRMNDAGTKWVQISGDNAVSGTYTPSLTNTINVSSSTAYACQYLRVGKTVTVSGRVDVTPTAAAPTQTQLDFSLPIPTTFGSANQCGGAGAPQSVAGRGMSFSAGSTKASMQWMADNNANQPVYFSFTYSLT